MRRRFCVLFALHSLTPTRRPRAGDAFTLVELLVTLGVISMLIALLSTSLARARTSSRDLACSSNLRQVAMAMMNYEVDSQRFPILLDASYGHMTRVDPGGRTTTLVKTWVDALIDRRYLPAGENGALPEVFTCPAADSFEMDSQWASYMPHFGYNFYIHSPIQHAPYAWLSPGEGRIPTSFEGKRSNIRRNQATAFLLADSRYINLSRGWFAIRDHVWIDRRHARGKGANVAFVDGRVELVAPRVFAPTSREDVDHPFANINRRYNR